MTVPPHLAPFRRIGHGGASALAPANTLRSFDAALDAGVDMVEFDVRDCGGKLVLAHTLLDARRPSGVRLEVALRHLAAPRFAAVALNVDLKRTGCEPAVLAALRECGLLERTLISCQVPAVLDRVRELDPRVRLGISIGGRAARFSQRWRDWRMAVVAGLTGGRWEALMVQHRLVDRALLSEVEAAGGLLYAWTVNDRARIDLLRTLGVHGIVTADPRLFAA